MRIEGNLQLWDESDFESYLPTPVIFSPYGAGVDRWTEGVIPTQK